MLCIDLIVADLVDVFPFDRHWGASEGKLFLCHPSDGF
jgi:hypothetical protein